MRSHRSRIGVLALSLGLSSFALACGGDGTTPSGVCNASGTGTLVVNVVGLPAGVNAKVSVVGPSGTQAVSASQTFAGAAGGSYSISADKVTQADPIVRTVYSATVSSATVCVSGSATQTVTVTYAPIPTSNKIWVAASNSPIDRSSHGFASSQLGATGNQEATVATKSGAGKRQVFDRDGNLWAVGGTTADPTVLRIPASALAASGPVTPDRKIDINLGCVPAATSLAFDKTGALWVGSPCSDAVYKLSADQLTASATVVPAVKLAAKDPAGLAFDKAGNLWVAADGNLARFDAAALGSSTSTPAVVLKAKTKATGGADLRPGALAFDATGNLWTYDFGGNVVFDFPAGELAGTTPKDVVPPALVTVGVTAVLEGLAFDEGGGLWTTFSQGKFARLAPAQLTVSTNGGNPTTPERVITSANLGYSEDIALYPAPAALPLYSALP